MNFSKKIYIFFFSLAPCLLLLECAGEKKYLSQRQHIRALLNPYFYFSKNICYFKENEEYIIVEGSLKGVNSTMKGGEVLTSITIEENETRRCELNLNLPTKIKPYFNDVQRIKLLIFKGENKKEGVQNFAPLLITNENNEIIFALDIDLKLKKTGFLSFIEVRGSEKKVYIEAGRLKDFCDTEVTHYAIEIKINDKNYILPPGESFAFKENKSDYLFFAVDNKNLLSSECENLSDSELVYFIIRTSLKHP